MKNLTAKAWTYHLMLFGFFLCIVHSYSISHTINDSLFDDVWIHEVKTSAVVYWQLNDISQKATGYLEYREKTDYL
jgi:hypothetical protein